MKNILITVLVLMVAVSILSGRLANTHALLNDTAVTGVSIVSAALNFSLNEDIDNKLELYLGDVKPGDAGVVNIIVNNSGTIPGKLWIKEESLSPKFEVNSMDPSGVLIDPKNSAQFEINWSLPAEFHNSGIDGTNFQLCYSFRFENGYQVEKMVVLYGNIIDPADAPTVTTTTIPTEEIDPLLSAELTEEPFNTPTTIPTEEVPISSTATPIEEVSITWTPTPTEELPDSPTAIPTEEP